MKEMTMKKTVINILVILCLIAAGGMLSCAWAKTKINSDCTYKGVPLYGKVKVVTSFPDFKVKVTNSFPDIKVKKVSSFADKCGEWNFVTSFPDFTIQFVDSFEDFSIEYVNSFPGLR